MKFESQPIHQQNPSENSNTQIQTLLSCPPLKYDKEYTLFQLIAIQKYFQLREGTKFQLIEGLNQMILACWKSSSQDDQSNLSSEKNNQNQCCFKIIFKIESSNQFSDLILNDPDDNQAFSIESQRVFLLVKATQLHSQNCHATQEDFIFLRNKNFLKQNQTFLQNIIYQKYELAKIPETPKVKICLEKVYIKHLCDFLGFDFLYHGLETSFESSKSDKNKKNQLNRYFDNHIMKNARQKFNIPSSKPKKIRKIPKPKYQISNSEEQEKSSSPYKTFIGKEHRKTEKTIKLRARFQPSNKSSNQVQE